MYLDEMLPRVASRIYYSILPKIRPNGHFGKVVAASRRRHNREWDSLEQIQARQLEKVNALLTHAVTKVPYYRRLASEGKIPARVDNLTDLDQLPILTKEIINREGKNLLAEGYPEAQLRKLATGGSTGQPLHFYSDEDTLLCKNAAESWSNTMAGLHRGSSVAFLWGAGEFEATSSQELRERLELLVKNRIFIDCFKMSETELELAHRRLTRFRPQGLIGYTSALVRLANFLHDRGITPNYPTKAVISSAETLDKVSRTRLQSTFNTSVFNRYGSREMGLIAVECEQHQGLHIDCENIYIELAKGPDESFLSRIFVTKLGQYSMPFFRYDVGDLAEGPLSSCNCGRGYPILKRVVGRVTEMIWMPDGACLPGELFPHLLKDCGIAEYQVSQAKDYSIEILLVKTQRQSTEQEAMMRRTIDQYLSGKVEIIYTYVDRIERSATGKLLPVISHVDKKR